jgi:hypothetical protein
MQASDIKQIMWAPQPDITAYELALCLPVLPKLLARTTRDGQMFLRGIAPPEFNHLTPEALRHFKIEDV